MKIRQTSAYCTGILKTSVTVGEEEINATWIISTFKATVKSFFQRKSEFFFLHHIMQLSMTFPKN